MQNVATPQQQGPPDGGEESASCWIKSHRSKGSAWSAWPIRRGVGSTGPYGHDGRSITLNDVILRHGGEAQASRDKYADLKSNEQIALQTFLNSLILFPPDDTASSLDPGGPTKAGFPQFGHCSIKLTVLFNDPTDPE